MNSDEILHAKCSLFIFEIFYTALKAICIEFHFHYISKLSYTYMGSKTKISLSQKKQFVVVL